MALISIDNIREVYNILKELKEAYDEYADKIEEAQLHLRMLQKIISDRDKTAALKADKEGPGSELKALFSRMEATVRDFQALTEEDDEDESSDKEKGKGEGGSPKEKSSGGKSVGELTTEEENNLRRLRKAKLFAKKVILATQAKKKTDELESMNKRMEMVLRMVDIETATAQAHALSMLSGQGAAELLNNAPESAKDFWQRNFMSRTSVPWTAFLLALERDCGKALRNALGNHYEATIDALRSILDSTCDGEIDIREFAEFVGAQSDEDLAVAADRDGDNADADAKKEKDLSTITMFSIMLSKLSDFKGCAKGQLSSLLMGGHTATIVLMKVLAEKYVVTADEHGDVKVWSKRSLVTGLEMIATARPSNRKTVAATLIGTGQGAEKVRQVCIGVEDGSIGVLDVFTSKIIRWFSPYDHALRDIAACPGLNHNVYACGEKSTISVYNGETGVVKGLLFGHRCEVTELACSKRRNGDALQILVSCSLDGTIRIWDMQTNVCAYMILATPLASESDGDLTSAQTQHRVYKNLSVTHPDRWQENRFLITAMSVPTSDVALGLPTKHAHVDFLFVKPVEQDNENGNAGLFALRGELDPSVLTLTVVSPDGKTNDAKRNAATMAFWIDRYRVSIDPKAGSIDKYCVFGQTNLLSIRVARPIKNKLRCNDFVVVHLGDVESDVVLNKDSFANKEDEIDDGPKLILTPAHAPIHMSLSDQSLLISDRKRNITTYTMCLAGRCPLGHALRLATIPPSSHTVCDMCSSVVSRVVLCCTDCNFDTCMNCAKVNLSGSRQEELFQTGAVALGRCMEKHCGGCLAYSKDAEEGEELCNLCSSTLEAKSPVFACNKDNTHLYCIKCRVKAREDDPFACGDIDVTGLSDDVSTAIRERVEEYVNEEFDNDDTLAVPAPLTLLSGRGIWAGHSMQRDLASNKLCAVRLHRGMMTAMNDTRVVLWDEQGRLECVYDVMKHIDDALSGGWVFCDGDQVTEAGWPVHHEKALDMRMRPKISVLTVDSEATREKPTREEQSREEQSTSLSRNETFRLTEIHAAKAISNVTTVLIGTDLGDIGVFELDAQGNLKVKSQRKVLHGGCDVCTQCGRDMVPAAGGVMVPLRLEERLFQVCQKCAHERYPLVKKQQFPLPRENGGEFDGAWIIKPRVEKQTDSMFSRAFREVKDTAGLLWQRRYMRLVKPHNDSHPWKIHYCESDKDSKEGKDFILMDSVEVQKIKSKAMRDAGCESAKSNFGFCLTSVNQHSDKAEARFLFAFENVDDYDRWSAMLRTPNIMKFQQPCVQCIKTRIHRPRLVPDSDLLCDACSDKLLKNSAVRISSLAAVADCIFAGIEPSNGAAPYIIEFKKDVSRGPKPRSEVHRWRADKDSISVVDGRKSAYIVVSSGCTDPAGFIFDTDTATPAKWLLRSVIRTRAPITVIANTRKYATSQKPAADEQSTAKSENEDDDQSSASSSQETVLDETEERVVLFVATEESCILMYSMIEESCSVTLQSHQRQLEWSPSTYCNRLSCISVVTPRESKAKVILAAGFDEGGILVWGDLQDADRDEVRSPCLQLLGHHGRITDMFITSSEHLYTASTDGTLHVWSATEVISQDRRITDKVLSQLEFVDASTFALEWECRAVGSAAIPALPMLEADHVYLCDMWSSYRDLRMADVQMNNMIFDCKTLHCSNARLSFSGDGTGDLLMSVHGTNYRVRATSKIGSCMMISHYCGGERNDYEGVVQEHDLSTNEGLAFFFESSSEYLNCNATVEYSIRLIASSCVNPVKVSLKGFFSTAGTNLETFDTLWESCEGYTATFVVDPKQMQSDILTLSSKDAGSSWRCPETSSFGCLLVTITEFDKTAVQPQLTFGDATLKCVLAPCAKSDRYETQLQQFTGQHPKRLFHLFCKLFQAIDDDIIKEFSQMQIFNCPVSQCLMKGPTTSCCPTHKVRYIEPHDVDSCRLCGSMFHEMNRRNCWSCGRFVCTNCAQFPLMDGGVARPKPVCIACFDHSAYSEAFKFDGRRERDVGLIADLDAHQIKPETLLCSKGHTMSEVPSPYDRGLQGYCDICNETINGFYDISLHCSNCREDRCVNCIMENKTQYDPDGKHSDTDGDGEGNDGDGDNGSDDEEDKKSNEEEGEGEGQ